MQNKRKKKEEGKIKDKYILPYFSVELFLRSFIAWLMIGFSLVCYGDMIVLRPIFQQLEKQAQSQGQ